MKKFIFIFVVAIVVLLVSNQAKANIPSVFEQYNDGNVALYDDAGDIKFTFKNSKELYQKICNYMEKEKPGKLMIFDKKECNKVNGFIPESLWEDLVEMSGEEEKLEIFIYDLSKDVIPEKEFEYIFQQYSYDSVLVIIKKL